MDEWESWERYTRPTSLENTPEGRVVNLLLQKEMKDTMKKEKEGGKEKEMEWEKPDCQDLQKHLKEESRDCWKKEKEGERDGKSEMEKRKRG